jgi:hypothetical protein
LEKNVVPVDKTKEVAAEELEDAVGPGVFEKPCYERRMRLSYSYRKRSQSSSA